MTRPAPLPILAVSGLKAEARIARGAGIVTVAGGGDARRLDQLLAEVGGHTVGAVISFGIAGGLAPGLPPGAVIVASGVEHEGTRWLADPPWLGFLRAALPAAHVGGLAGVDRAVAGACEKARLHAGGALAVDMESHVAARFASRHELPFAALRVVADPAERTLPEAALVGMRPDGTTDVRAVLAALARQPGDLAALIRTALDARAAFAALRRSRAQAGTSFSFGPPAGSVPEAGLAPRATSRPGTLETEPV